MTTDFQRAQIREHTRELKDAGVPRAALLARLFVLTGFQIDLEGLGRLATLADRYHTIRFGKPLPDLPDDRLDSGELGTIGWTASSYGGLTLRELDLLIAGGAPFADDLKSDPRIAAFLAQTEPTQPAEAPHLGKRVENRRWTSPQVS